MTENQITALSKVGKSYDFFAKTIRQALQAGVSPETIVDFLDDPATQITNRVLRKIIEREVIVVQEPPAELGTGTEEDDTADQDRIEEDDENAPTIVIESQDE